MLRVISFDWLPASTWEALGVWLEAVALIAIFVLDLRERRDERIERMEQRREREEERKVREDERREREEIRRERVEAEKDRQRSDVSFIELIDFDRSAPEQTLFDWLWRTRVNKQAGFVVERFFWVQLPNYLRQKSQHLLNEINKPILPQQRMAWRQLLVFKFPIGDFNAVLDDLRHLNSSDDAILAWDENGKRVKL